MQYLTTNSKCRFIKQVFFFCVFRKSQKAALIARRVAKSDGRGGSWRKTWSRSFRKNILGLDDPDDPEAARLRKYRTRRKKYGGKHFIIAVYDCGKTTATAATTAIPVSRQNSVAPANGTPAADEDNLSGSQVVMEEKEPDTFCIELMGESTKYGARSG